MTENQNISFKNKAIYSFIVLLFWGIMLFCPIWRFEYMPYSVFNDQEYNLMTDFELMQKYSFHLNLILVSGPVFALSSFINPKKLILGLLVIFLITLVIGWLGFYFSDKVSLMWGWYVYGAGVFVIHSFIATKLFPGIFERKIIEKLEEKGGSIETDQNQATEDFERKKIEKPGKKTKPAPIKPQRAQVEEKNPLIEVFLTIAELKIDGQTDDYIKEHYLLNKLKSMEIMKDKNAIKTPEENNAYFLIIADGLLAQKENVRIALKVVAMRAESLEKPSYANAESKIYNVRRANGSKYEVIGYFEHGKIYNVRRANGSKYEVIGYFESGKIYNVRRANGSKYEVIGYFEHGKIYNVRRANGSKYEVIGYVEFGKIYNVRRANGSKYEVIGYFERGDSCGAAAAFLLLL